MITRRHLLATAAASFASRPLWAATSLTMGAMQIDTLSDGHLMLPKSFAFDGDAPAGAEDIL